jgi:hypothetical protein
MILLILRTYPVETDAVTLTLRREEVVAVRLEDEDVEVRLVETEVA